MTDFLVKNKLEQIVENFKVSDTKYSTHYNGKVYIVSVQMFLLRLADIQL